MGRHFKIREAATLKKVAKHLRSGVSYRDTAKLIGISYDTFHKELQRNKEFRELVDLAETEGKQVLIRRAGEKRPDWLLAKKWPDEFANKDKYTLKQIDESVNKIFAELISMIPEDKRDHAAERIRQAIISLAIQGGELPPADGAAT